MRDALFRGQLGVGRQDVSFDAAVEEERGGEEVGAVEARDGEGDDVVEGGVGADVDAG